MPEPLRDGAPESDPTARPETEPTSHEPKVLGLGAKWALATLAVIAVALVVIGYMFWGLDPANRPPASVNAPILFRLCVIVVLTLFIPFTAVSYYLVRRDVRRRQLREDCRALGLDYEHYYHIYKRETRENHFLYAVCFTSVVTLLGLTAILLGMELGLNKEPNLLLLGTFESRDRAAVEAYQAGPLLFFGMAFLGAYLWGLQHVLHRYHTSDLVPGVYYGLGMRMIFAAFIALMVYHMLPDLESNGSDGGTIAGSFLPALAFMIGIFPQRALQYMTDRVNAIVSPRELKAQEIPLELIQGISINDRMRLAEEGVESCYDLASAEFVQLLFTTPFQPLELIDWQLQARLVLYFGQSIEELRAHGIRTITELKMLDDATAQDLAEKTGATKNAISMARRRAEEDGAIEFLESLRRTLVVGDSIKKCAQPPRDDEDRPIATPSQDEVAGKARAAAAQHRAAE
ncbi:MAG: hypothetical protein RH942_02615 [Kiloniellaceae bacterium]